MSDNALVADTTADTARRIGIRLAALAQDGLTFADGDYDLDRYRQVSTLAAELLAVISGRPAAELTIELGRRPAADHRQQLGRQLAHLPVPVQVVVTGGEGQPVLGQCG